MKDFLLYFLHSNDNAVAAQTDVTKIYKSLVDEISKDVFANRLLFSLTRDYKYIYNVCANENNGKWQQLFAGKTQNVVLYGIGEMAERFVAKYPYLNICAFVDGNQDKQEHEFMGKPIISPETLKENYANGAIVITPMDDDTIKQILDKLFSLGFTPEQCMVLKYAIYNWITELRYIELPFYYFEKDIVIPCQDEIFVDAGCRDFHTSLKFIKWCDGRYKKIFAFEPSNELYLECVKNAANTRDATVLPYGLWNETTELFFDDRLIGVGASHVISNDADYATSVKVVSLDDFLKGEPVTFIKMDIEGSELNALKGASDTIMKYRPKLAISIYHRPEDIWEIPKYILSLNQDYKLYMRHYSNYTYETILYAV